MAKSNLIKLKQIEGGKELAAAVGAPAVGNVGDENYKAASGLYAEIETLEESVAEQVQASKPEVYQINSESTKIEELVALLPENTVAKAGDTLIVTNKAGVKSAYQYDEEDEWVACDGLVSADNVIMHGTLTLAGNYTQLGNWTKTETGTVEKNVDGLSVSSVLKSITTATLQPEITSEPEVTLTFGKAGAYEVGTSIEPQYSATLSAGSYTYGPDTGITAASWEVTDTNGGSSTSAAGSFTSFVVDDNTNYSITATATYNDGAVATDNLKNPSNPTVQIEGGTASKTSSAVTGYRSYFYGVLSTTSEEAPLTSAIIRGLTNGGKYNGVKSFTLNASATSKRFVIAIPSSSTRGGLSEVILTSAMQTPITDMYIKTAKAVQVKGVTDTSSAVDYDVWVYEPSKIDAGEVHAIKLA